ncbi:MAG: hypothetical protein E7665_03610 [Ruminococcaceae bacterium]|nr:hypothetical protein [Oscillospiraceae bacterium]
MKKMRFMSLIIVVVLLLTSVLGCGMSSGQEADYIALEIGTFDADDGGLHTSEFAIWDENQTNYHQDAKAAENVSVTFNGKSYSGDYQRSATKVPNLYVSHRYKGDKVFFEVNGTTGELTSITFVYEPSESSSLSQEQCRTIADSIVDDYIEIDEYCTTVISQPIYSNCLYTFTYYREISGYKSADSLTISIDGNGNVSSFGKSMLGSFDEIEAVSVDSKKAADTIDAKLESIYKSNSKRKSHSVDNVLLIKLEDGTCAFLYTVDNQFEDAEVIYGSRVQILLKTSHTGQKK